MQRRIYQWIAAALVVVGIPAAASVLGLTAAQAGLLYIVLAGAVGAARRETSVWRTAAIQTACWVPWAMAVLGALVVWEKTDEWVPASAAGMATMAIGYALLVAEIVAVTAVDTRLTGGWRRLWRLVGVLVGVPYLTPLAAVVGVKAASAWSGVIADGDVVAVSAGMILAAMRTLVPLLAALMYGALYFVRAPGTKRRRAVAAFTGLSLYLAAAAFGQWLVDTSPTGMAAVQALLMEAAGIVASVLAAERLRPV